MAIADKLENFSVNPLTWPLFYIYNATRLTHLANTSSTETANYDQVHLHSN